MKIYYFRFEKYWFWFLVCAQPAYYVVSVGWEVSRRQFRPSLFSAFSFHFLLALFLSIPPFCWKYEKRRNKNKGNNKHTRQKDGEEAKQKTIKEFSASITHSQRASVIILIIIIIWNVLFGWVWVWFLFSFLDYCNAHLLTLVAY